MKENDIKMNNELICIIPCREGSMRLSHKNRKMLCGKPLWEWTLLQAISIKEIDVIYITTDDHEIIEECMRYEREDIRVKIIIRPQYLATAETPMYAVVEHACQGHGDDSVVLLLQCTSPLRNREDILSCLLVFELYGKGVGIISTSWSFPAHEMKINGAIYLQYLSTIRNTKSFIQRVMLNYIMPPERSIDIDYQKDFKLAEIELEKRLNKNNVD